MIRIIPSSVVGDAEAIFSTVTLMLRDRSQGSKARRRGDARLDAQLGDLTRQVHIRRPRVVHLAEHARSGEEQRIERRALQRSLSAVMASGFWL